jgi:hypothetical protein
VKSIEEINQDWKVLIEKEKVRLIVKHRPEFFEFIRKIRITKVRKTIIGYDVPCNWEIYVVYEGKRMLFTNFDENFPSTYPELLNDQYNEVQTFSELLKKGVVKDESVK